MTQQKILFMMMFLVLILYLPFANAQTSGISASTNKPSYKPGDKVTITGTVDNPIAGIPVTILIRNPIQNVYNVGQVEIQNNVFVHDFVINNNSKPGTYNIEVKHGTASTKLQFILSSGVVQNISVEGEIIKVRGDQLGLIKYKNPHVLTQDKAITIELEAISLFENPIMQEFEIPKNLIDAPGQSLVVEIDGTILNCSETVTNDSRILNCLIPHDSRELRITGTSIIPEFGQIAIMILIIGTSIVVLCSRHSLRQHFY